jgi:hypothetical protein
MPRPKLFIGSSTTGLPIAKALQLQLKDKCECKIWNQGVFGLSQTPLESLESIIKDLDFSVLVLTPDDMILSTNQAQKLPRDNVLYELGFFTGAIGRNRTFIVCDRSTKVKIPTNLAGIIVADFEMHSDKDIRSSVGPAATEIEFAIEKLGIITKTLTELSTQTSKSVENLPKESKEIIEKPSLAIDKFIGTWDYKCILRGVGEFPEGGNAHGGVCTIEIEHLSNGIIKVTVSGRRIWFGKIEGDSFVEKHDLKLPRKWQTYDGAAYSDNGIFYKYTLDDEFNLEGISSVVVWDGTAINPKGGFFYLPDAKKFENLELFQILYKKKESEVSLSPWLYGDVYFENKR